MAVFTLDAAAPVLAKDEIDADIRFLYVQPGQTLHNIVRRLYPERPRDWEKLEQQIVRENPHAFVDGDKTRMKAGVRLELPNAEQQMPSGLRCLVRFQIYKNADRVKKVTARIFADQLQN